MNTQAAPQTTDTLPPLSIKTKEQNELADRIFEFQQKGGAITQIPSFIEADKTKDTRTEKPKRIKSKKQYIIERVRNVLKASKTAYLHEKHGKIKCIRKKLPKETGWKFIESFTTIDEVKAYKEKTESRNV